MRITIFAVGSRGDIQPFVALGTALKRAGHSVRIASHRPYATFIESHGLLFSPIAGDPRALLQGELAKSWLESGRNPLQFVRRFFDLSADYVDPYLATSLAASRDAEAILYSTLGIAAYHLAEYHRVPCISVALQPLGRTRDHPAIFLPASLRLGRAFNWTSHLILEQLLWQPARRTINHWRQETLALPPLPLSGPLPMIYRGFHPTLYGISPQVYPKPDDYPAHHHFTGYWFLDQAENWDPPAALKCFLANGPPPIYFGLGSMTSRDPARFSAIFAAALKNTGQRGVLLTGWGHLPGAHSGENMITIDTAPHDWLFPRMRALVHHGGAGTTAAGLRAGVPALIIPFFGDQPFWGDQIFGLGVGPRPIRQAALTEDRLSAAIGQILDDPGMSARAQALAESIRSERGLENAVSWIEKYLALPESVPQIN